MPTDLNATLSQVLSDVGAVAWGFVDVSELQPYRPTAERMQSRFDQLSETYNTALVAAFPLYNGPEDSHIVLCFRAGVDYVHLGKARLTRVFDALKPIMGDNGRVSGNGYPLPIVAAARLAGVGLTGRHGLCIVAPYGTTISLASVVWSLSEDIRAQLPRHAPSGFCTACGTGEDVAARCQAACPTGALSWKSAHEGGQRLLDLTRCCSELSQKKGDLTVEEQTLLRRSPYVWGCDLCQLACPYNRDPRRTDLPELLEDRTLWITKEELEAGLHDHRPLVRTGRETVLRNLEMMKG